MSQRSVDFTRLRSESDRLLVSAQRAFRSGHAALRRELAARPELEPSRLAASVLRRAAATGRELRVWVREAIEEQKARTKPESTRRSYRAGTRERR